MNAKYCSFCGLVYNNQNPFENDDVDTIAPNNGDQEVDELTSPRLLQLHASSLEGISTTSSAAELPVTATSSCVDFEQTPCQLRDAFIGDLQYVDERPSSVERVVFQSSSSSLSSEAEQRNSREMQRQTSQVQETGEVKTTMTAADEGDQEKTSQDVSEVAEPSVTQREEVSYCAIPVTSHIVIVALHLFLRVVRLR